MKLLICSFGMFLTDLYKKKELILQLTLRDFRTRYLGSYLGLLWAFVQPAVTILILWFVFDIGFKSAPVDDLPFILWLITGYIPWLYFSEGLSNATHSITENSYLVQKMVFRVSMLPIIKVLSALMIHVFFALVIIAMFSAHGIYPSLHVIQLIYFCFSTFVLLVGLSWITSSLVIFLKDIGQAISIVLQIGFWLTPIFWSLKIVPEQFHIFIKLNPIYYIIEGYRDTFIYRKWFWEEPIMTCYFWGVTLSIFIIGAIVFTKLRPHFSDVL